MTAPCPPETAGVGKRAFARPTSDYAAEQELPRRRQSEVQFSGRTRAYHVASSARGRPVALARNAKSMYFSMRSE